jgi:hypothetical protein
MTAPPRPARLGNPRSREQIREIIHLAKNKMGIGAEEDLVLIYLAECGTRELENTLGKFGRLFD